MRKTLLLYLILFSLLGTGCGNLHMTKIDYNYTSQSIEYADGSYSFERNLDYLAATHAQYYFDTTIDDSQRRACVEATERILGEIEQLEENPIICVLETIEPYISEHTLYVTAQDWHSVDYTTMVFLAASGQFSHYGSAYGYANLLCDRFGWETGKAEQISVPNVVDTYDLNYLCFEGGFTQEHDITVAKFTACDFVNTYIAEFGEDSFQQMLLKSDTSAGMDLLANELEQYYARRNLDAEVSTVRYGFGGTSNDYIVVSDYAAFYICDDWKDELAGVNPLISENFLRQNYAEVRQFFDINLGQMKQYQELFALDSYNNDLDIFFTSSTTHGNISIYYLNHHAIYLKSIADLTHEYIHALTIPAAVNDLETWSSEGVAAYFAVWYDWYSRDYLNQDYNSASVLDALRNKLGRPLDVEVDNDEILSYLAYSKGYDDPNKNYLSGAAFVSYLVNQYGAYDLVPWLCDSGEPLPKSSNAWVNDWTAYLNATYGEE